MIARNAGREPRSRVLRCATFGRVDAIELLLPALGLALFLEGLPWFVSPSGVRRTMSWILTLEDRPLRLVGLALMTGGLALSWWALRG